MNQAELNLSYFMESARKELERQAVAKNIADEIKRQQEVYEQGVRAMLLASNQESNWLLTCITQNAILVTLADSLA